MPKPHKHNDIAMDAPTGIFMDAYNFKKMWIRQWTSSIKTGPVHIAQVSSEELPNNDAERSAGVLSAALQPQAGLGQPKIPDDYAEQRGLPAVSPAHPQQGGLGPAAPPPHLQTSAQVLGQPTPFRTTVLELAGKGLISPSLLQALLKMGGRQL